MKPLRVGLLLVISACAGLAQESRPAEELKYVLIVARHGVRAPTWTLERLNRYSASPWPDFGVPPGHLTARGRELMMILGGYYRDVYAGEGLLGKAGCVDAGRIYLWADTDQRTMESARAVAEGMLPDCKLEVHSMHDGRSDPLFDPIEAGIARPDSKLGVAAVTGRTGPALDAVVEAQRPAFDALARLLNGSGKAASSIFDERMAITAGKDGISMSGPLRLASTFTENLLLEYTNGMSGKEFGWGQLNAASLRQLMTLHTTYAELMRRTPYLAQARGSNLLSHVLRSMEQAVSGKPVKGAIGGPETALTYIAGHDTNLSNLSALLRLSWVMPSHQPDDIPPGGALVFSLWKSPATRRYSVRLQFVVQTLDQMHSAARLSIASPPPTAELFLPGCSRASAGYACEWQSFVKTATEAIAQEFVEKQ